MFWVASNWVSVPFFSADFFINQRPSFSIEVDQFVSFISFAFVILWTGKSRILQTFFTCKFEFREICNNEHVTSLVQRKTLSLKFTNFCYLSMFNLCPLRDLLSRHKIFARSRLLAVLKFFLLVLLHRLKCRLIVLDVEKLSTWLKKSWVREQSGTNNASLVKIVTRN